MKQALMDNTVGSLTEEQKSLIVGSLLGDGYMSCKTHAYLKICHSIAQKQYVDWKYRLLAPLVRTKPKAYKGNGKRIGYRFCTRSLPVLTDYYDKFYGCHGRKHIPDNLRITPLALAVWFMDDGARSWKSVYFNTQQFIKTDQEKLLSFLRADFGLIGKLNKDKKYLRIRLSQDSARKMIIMIQSIMLECMKYKLPL